MNLLLPCHVVAPTVLQSLIAPLFRLAAPVLCSKFLYCNTAKCSFIDAHKRTAWRCTGCDRIPNAEKLAFIRAKIFNIWSKSKATFTCK